MKENSPRRIRVLWWIFLLVPAIIIIRLADLQLVHHSFYMERSEDQRTRLLLPAAHRGDIRDRNGRILATMVYAVPKEIIHPKEAARVVGDALSLHPEELYHILTNKKSFIWIARKVDTSRAKMLQEKKVTGIYFLEEQKRVYPHGHLAAPLLGFVGTDNEGLSGIELALDRDLKGKAGRVLIEGDPTGRQIAHGKAQYLEEAERGDDVFLTIDLYLQHVMEKVLQSNFAKFRAQSATAIAVDIPSGEILSMASLPGFDPNQYGKSSKESWRARPITDLYEPGSTFKVITVATGLEENKITDKTELNFYNTIEVGGRTIGNSHPITSLPGKYSVTDMLCQSVNTGAVQIGIKLGKDALYKGIRRFGFGEKLLENFPGEGRGILHPPERWAASDIGMMTFGQSIAVTPLQLVHAVASIGNKGVRIQPSLVQKIQQPDGSQIRSNVGRKMGEALSPHNADMVLRMLEQVVLRGSGRRAQIAGYRVGGKTGTAQKVVGGKYLKKGGIEEFGRSPRRLG